jgi:hypothetical protein
MLVAVAASLLIATTSGRVLVLLVAIVLIAPLLAAVLAALATVLLARILTTLTALMLTTLVLVLAALVLTLLLVHESSYARGISQEGNVLESPAVPKLLRSASGLCTHNNAPTR